MKRLITISFVSLLATALIAPAAHAGSKTLRFQDRSVSGGGEIRLDVVYANKRPKGRFTPRRVVLYLLEIVPVSCNPGGDQFMAGFGPDDPIKVTEGKFVHDFATEGFTGALRGKLTRSPARAVGSFDVTDVDFGPGQMNCTTNGARAYDASRCRLGNEDLKLPVCRVGG